MRLLELLFDTILVKPAVRGAGDAQVRLILGLSPTPCVEQAFSRQRKTSPPGLSCQNIRSEFSWQAAFRVPNGMVPIIEHESDILRTNHTCASSPEHGKTRLLGNNSRPSLGSDKSRPTPEGRQF